MKIYVTVKQAGKRKDYLTKKELYLEQPPTTLRELLSSIIRQSVQEYNEKSMEPSLIKFLSNDEIVAQSKTGKIGFGRLYNAQQADQERAIETALVSFTDGIFRVFHGESELTELDDPTINVNEGDVFTFIKFAMISGRMW